MESGAAFAASGPAEMRPTFCPGCPTDTATNAAAARPAATGMPRSNRRRRGTGFEQKVVPTGSVIVMRSARSDFVSLLTIAVTCLSTDPTPHTCPGQGQALQAGLARAGTGWLSPHILCGCRLSLEA